MARSLVSETKDLWLLIKGEIGGVAFWRSIARFIRPGTWKGKALQLHKKAYMYLIPAKAVDIVPGYIYRAYAMWIRNPKIIYWPGKKLTIIKEGEEDPTEWNLKITLTDPFENEQYDVTPVPWWKKEKVHSLGDYEPKWGEQ